MLEADQALDKQFHIFKSVNLKIILHVVIPACNRNLAICRVVLPNPSRLWQHCQKDNGTVCLPVEVRHDCLWSISPSFLQNADNLERCIAVPARMDDNGAPELGLSLRCCLKHSVLTLSQRPGATYFSHYTTLDVSPIRSIEYLINNNACKLENRKMRFFVINTICVK